MFVANVDIFITVFAIISSINTDIIIIIGGRYLWFASLFLYDHDNNYGD